MNYQNIKYIILMLFFICGIIACKELSTREKELKNNLNKTLHLKISKTIQQANNTLLFDDLIQTHRYISVVYLQNSCDPCYPKFIEWQQKMDSINTPSDYTVLFVIQGKSYERFMNFVLSIEYVDDKFYTIMDSEGKFMEQNKDIPRWIIDAGILIDAENKIKMVGAPWLNDDMTELFYKTVNS